MRRSRRHSRSASDPLSLSSLATVLEETLSGEDNASLSFSTTHSSEEYTTTTPGYAATLETRCLQCQAIEQIHQLQPCLHWLCDRCIRSLLVGTDRTTGQVIVCPACKSDVEELDRPFAAAIGAHIFKQQVVKPVRPPRPGGESLRRSISSSSVHSGVVRITNFPASLRTAELEALVEPLVGEISVHIIQSRDPQDGRTISPLFIEILEGAEAAEVAAESLNGKVIRDQPLCCEMGTQEEMLEYIFPSWQAGFTGSQPFFLYDGKPFEGNFLREDEIRGMLELCKLESPYALLAPERPFLNIASIMSKLPWRQPYLFSPTFAASLVATALGALNILFLVAKDHIPDYLDVATKLVQSIYDCPAASAADIAGVSRIVEYYWPNNSPSSVRIPTEPYTSPEPSPHPTPPDDFPSSPELEPQAGDQSMTITPLNSNRPSLDSMHGKYSPPHVNTERSYARRRPPDANALYASIADELGVDEDLVRSIARRLR